MMFCRLRTTLPSQKQLKWSQLRVGLTVLFASVTLMVLIFVMSGTGGWFTRKITLRSYFDDAGGLREGAPVRLAGVDIGNVTAVRIMSSKPTTPVEVTMKVNTKYSSYLRKDSVTLMSTAGVLGETFVNIDSAQAKGPEATDGDTLPARDQPAFAFVRVGLGNLDASKFGKGAVGVGLVLRRVFSDVRWTSALISAALKSCFQGIFLDSATARLGA